MPFLKFKALWYQLRVTIATVLIASFNAIMANGGLNKKTNTVDVESEHLIDSKLLLVTTFLSISNSYQFRMKLI